MTRQGKNTGTTDTGPTQEGTSIFTGFQEEYFTRGSHEDDVLRLQGTPSELITYIERVETWFFGDSMVLIGSQTRRVLEWLNEGNLKVIYGLETSRSMNLD